jgi:UPF0176 protein
MSGFLKEHRPGSADELFHIAFYKFVELPDPEKVVSQLRNLTQGLLGSILVAQEGINGVLAGTAKALDEFETAIRTDKLFEERFSDLVFKRSACKTIPFARIKVHRKSEIVALGLPSETSVDAICQSGTQVSPQDWRKLITEDNVVVIDNRNSFEYRLGRFKSAVDPKVSNFRDFPKFIQDNAGEWRRKGTKVAMYCTGGIRCEKTAPWMQELGLDVYQLEGGILNYFQALPDAEKDWEGECFVFDNRIALDTKLQETSTTMEQVYTGDPAEEWRLQRAKRLDAAGK